MLGHFPLAIIGAAPAPPTLTSTCGNDPGLACRLVWDLSHSAQAAQMTDNYLSGPIHLALRVAFVVLLALVIRALLHRLINRVTERATQAVLLPFRNPLPGGRVLGAVRRVPRRRPPVDADPAVAENTAAENTAAENTGAENTVAENTAAENTVAENTVAEYMAAENMAAAAVVETAMVAERRHQRVRALGSILRSAASVTIFAIAGVVVLGDLGINLAPLLASAGVVGIAVGFGAQNLVRDYLTGVFMLLEDQYGVGDVISVGDATGTVETLTLRITRVRDVNGVVWHIRNGTIDQVGNKSQGWARAVIDFPVSYLADLATIRSILDAVAEAAWDDPVLRGVMLEKPEIWGAQDVSSTVVTMRMVARTAPLRQWEVEREMRARVKTALDAAGIAPPVELAGAAVVADNTASAASPAPGARRHRRTSDDSLVDRLGGAMSENTPAEPVTFYEAAGGEETFTRLVRRFYQEVAADPVLRPVYPAKNLGPAEEHLRLFLIQYWGGPQAYNELRGHPRLRMRHVPFRVGPVERDHWLLHMRTAMDEVELPEELDAQLWDYLVMAAHSLVNHVPDGPDSGGRADLGVRPA